MKIGICGRILRFVRNHIKSMLFLIAFTVFFYLNVLALNYYQRLELINSYNNTPYNAYARQFIMSSENGQSIDLSMLEQEEALDGCVLFKVREDVQGIYEVVYCAEGAVSMDNCNIDEWDFNSKELWAVVGCDSSRRIGDTFVYDDREYTIVGVLDKHVSEAVNYGIFFSNNTLDTVEIDSSYILTSKDKEMAEDGFVELEKLLENQGIDVKEIEVRETEFGDYIKYDGLVSVIFGVLILFYLLILAVATKLWMVAKRAEVYVRRLLGERYVRIKVYLQYVLLWGVALGINVILCG